MSDDVASPLSEVTPDSVDAFLETINDDLASGMPERITDDRLTKLIAIYREEAVRWAQTDATKTTRVSRGSRKTVAEAIDIDITI